MAYADYEFYKDTFFGNTLPEAEANRWLEAASDELDCLTYMRLSNSFPVVQAHVVKVKKAVCAIADALFQIDIQNRALSAQLADDGNYRGAVSSITSGRESISYSQVNANGSVYASAASSEKVKYALISQIAAKYVANIPDATGTNLLYGGLA